jgi:O-antigen ligase
LLLALIAIVYFVLLLRDRSTFRHPMASLRIVFVPYLIFLGFVVLQIIPFGTWVSPINISLEGGDVASQTMSLTPGMSFLYFIQFTVYGLLFFLILQVSYNAFRARSILIALFVMVVVFAAYALFVLHQFDDKLLFFEKWAYQGYATGTFVNRNSFATFLSFGMVIGSVFSVVCLLPGDEKTGQQKNLLSGLLYLSGTIVIFAALISTQSRMGFAAGCVGTFMACMLVLFRAPMAMRFFWPGVLVFLGGTVVLFVLYGSGLLERVGSVESATDVRFAFYDQVWGMIANRPWTGYGAGSFELAFPLFHQLPVSPDVVWDKAHSTYLTLWSEMGVVFGSLPIIMVMVIGAKIWTLYRSTKTRWTHAAIGLGVIVTAGMHSLVDFSLEIHAVTLLFVMILAVAMAGPQKTQRADGDA